MDFDIYLKKYWPNQSKFAEEIGDSAQNVSRYALKKRIPKKDKMQAIAEKTGYLVTANDFYDILIPPAPEVRDFSDVVLPPDVKASHSETQRGSE